MELKLKFSSLKLLGGQDPDEWLLELDLLRIRLDEMGSPVTDEDFIAHVLNNLTPEYSELITSLEGTLESLVVEVLKERILSFYRRKSAGDYAELNHIQSNSRNQHHKTDGNTWKPGRNQCYWCLRKGHTVLQCRQRSNGKGSTRRPDGTYYKGKLSREITEKKKDHNNSFMAASFCLETTNEKTVANSTQVSQGITERGSGMWLVDSRCNKHTSPHREDFQNMRPTNVTCIFGNKGRVRADSFGPHALITRKKSEGSVPEKYWPLALQTAAFLSSTLSLPYRAIRALQAPTPSPPSAKGWTTTPARSLVICSKTPMNLS